MWIKSSCRLQKLLSVIYALLVLIPSVAAATEASKYFEIGVKAAQQQQYHVALKAFLQAKSAGLNSPELSYNLGVVHYKLGDFTKAQQNFQRLSSNEKYTAIAYYNLGLAALKLKKRNSAEQWFQKAYAIAEDPNLIALSAKAMDRLKGIVVPAAAPVRRSWKGIVSTNIGYDSNVASIDEAADQTQGASDLVAELLATTSRMLWGDKYNGFRFSGNVYFLDHSTEHDYDYSKWHAAFAYVARAKGWRFRSMLSTDHTRYANMDYLRLDVLELRGRYSFWKDTRFDLRYKYYDVDDIGPNSEYEYLQGSKQQWRVRINHKIGPLSWKLSYTYEENDRQDSNIPSTIIEKDQANQDVRIAVQKFRSYSPVRHGIQLKAKMHIFKNTKLVFDTQYRNSDYQYDDTTTKEDGTIIYKKTRVDNRYRITLGIEQKLNDEWELFTDYRFTKNNSNRERSDYKRSQIAVGVTWYY